ncbi:MAG: hypothetical protein UC208_02720, partial [Oscillospiraceae bacterium]|nr:hypothetical protein [Oscillospiraceae bacterium]
NIHHHSGSSGAIERPGLAVGGAIAPPPDGAHKRFAAGKALGTGGFTPSVRNKITGPQTPRLRRLGNKQQVIYKHAISTIIPVHPVPLNDPGLPSEAQ